MASANATEARTVVANASTPAKRRKKRARKPEQYSSYLVRSETWEFCYQLRPTDPKNRFDTGAYSELAQVTLSGEVVQPASLKIVRASITFSARAGMLTEAEPHSFVGNITVRGDELSAYVFFPIERAGLLATMIQSGRIQIVHMTATPLRYRSASIINISMDTEYRPEDW